MKVINLTVKLIMSAGLFSSSIFATAVALAPCKKDFDETLSSVTQVKELKRFTSKSKVSYALYEISFNEDGVARGEYFLIEKPADSKSCRIVIRDQSILGYRSGMSPDLMPKNIDKSVIEEASLIQARHEAGTTPVSRKSYLTNLERLDGNDENVKWLVSTLKAEWSIK